MATGKGSANFGQELEKTESDDSEVIQGEVYVEESQFSMATGKGSANFGQELEKTESDDSEGDHVPSSKKRKLIPSNMPNVIRGNSVSIGGNQTIVSGDQIKIETMVINNGEQRKNKDVRIDDFNLESVRRQLMQEYKETRSKLPLLPGMPEECATMEDLFVDFELIEEDKKSTGVIPRKLESYGELVCIKKYINTEEESESKEYELVKRLLIKGKPGAGKSSGISKLAYDWACNKPGVPISEYQLVLAIAIDEICAKSCANLVDIIQDQLLPEVSRQGLEEYIRSNASSIVLLLDGYDEVSQYFHSCKDIQNILRSKWLQEACVIVTTRPNQVADFCLNYGPYTQVEIKGFSKESREVYVAKFFQFRKERYNSSDNGDNDGEFESKHTYSFGENDENHAVSRPNDKQVNASNLLRYLNNSPRLYELSAIPLILSMLCLLWIDDRKLPSGVTAIYRDVIMHLAKHRYAKNRRDIPRGFQSFVETVLYHIGEVAIEGIFQDKLVFKVNSFDEKELEHVEEACLLGLVTKERKRSGVNITHTVTFLHKTFQEVCGAFYWGKILETKIEKFNYYLRKLTIHNVFQMEYLLRFACGLNFKAAEHILPYVAQIICKNGELINNHLDMRNDMNECQQIPLFLLHETELNNADITNVDTLHTLLKPLYNSLTFELELSIFNMNKEFCDVLDFYTTSYHQQRHERGISSHGDTWLGDVQMMTVIISDRMYEVSNSVAKGVKFLCSVPNLSRLRIRCNSHNLYRTTCTISSFLEHLLTNHFTGALISELHLVNVSADSDKFSLLISTMPILTKLELRNVRLNGKLTCAFPSSSLKEFKLYSRFNIDPILSGFSQTADMIEQQNRNKPQVCHESRAFPTCLQLERITIVNNDTGARFKRLCNDNPMHKLVKASRYLLHLRYLDLSCTKMDFFLCGKLFDGLIEAGKDVRIQNHQNINGSVLGVRSLSGLKLEELDLSRNHIGDSLGKLASAYEYMPCLKRLRLHDTALEASQCEQLLDKLTEMGSKIEDSKQKSEAGSEEPGLSIENLDLSSNRIGNSIGRLCQAYRYMPRLKCLNLSLISLNELQCAKLFDCFLETGERMVNKNHENTPENDNLGVTTDNGLVLEELDISWNKIGDSIEKLGQTYRYMTRLRCLNLRNAGLNESQCKKLFDCFLETGKRLQIKNQQKSHSLELKLSEVCGLALEELNLAYNDIGDSVRKLSKAYRYMTNLRCLTLKETKLTQCHCEVLFDEFISTGKRLAQQESSLSIESLDLFNNKIGESSDKLLQAIKYMSHLKTLNLCKCELQEEYEKLIGDHLEDTNATFIRL